MRARRLDAARGAVPGWPTWQRAWQQALYGPGGFYLSPGAPGRSFSTAATGSARSRVLADALLRLAAEHGCARVLDVGAGGGELLTALAAGGCDLELAGVDLAPRPAGLPARVSWSPTVPDLVQDALVVALELLDVVPCPVLEVDETGLLRQVRVDPVTGREQLAEPADEASLRWVQRWWPLDGTPGSRVEVGIPRERVWADLVARIRGGVAVVVDYAHTRSTRPPGGTLVGYRDGRVVAPVPDGSCDLTAHVALDSVAAAGQARLGGRAGDSDRFFPLVTSQREALASLGVHGRRPPLDLAGSDPSAYLGQLARAGEAAHLLDPDGLGGFGWLVQPVPSR